MYAADANVTVKLKKDYEKLNHKTIQQLKNEVLSCAYRLRMWDVSLEARSSSENFQGGGGDALMGGSEELLKLMGMGNQRERIVIKGQDYER